MKFLLAIVLVAFVAQTQAFPRASKIIGTRIVGGADAPLGSVPHQISLLSGGVRGSHICGGSIISEEYIVTAAHCAVAASSFGVRVGTNVLSGSPSDSQTVAVNKVVVHPEYDDWTIYNDIAVMRLATKLTLSPSVRTAAIELAAAGYAASGDVTVTGWGTTSQGSGTLPNTLKTVTVPVVSDDECRDAYGQADVADSMLCAGLPQGGKDSCQGDSGGPLVEKSSGKLVGIVSWGAGCAQAGYPGVYTEVSYFRDFISENTL